MNNIENIQEYIPTVYVNDSEPDLDETNLNKTEQAIKRVTDAANKAIDALKQLDREKLALSAISNVLSDATDKVPSLALANTMQLAINDLNSNLSKKADANTVSSLDSAMAPLKTNLVGDINNNTVGVVNIVAWDSNTTSTPKSTGNTIYGNGFCLTYSTGNQWLCQLAMAVGDSHLFTRHRREGVWSGWTTIGTPSN